jgi:glucosamine kinase
MGINMIENDSVYLGIDGGGSKCKAILVNILTGEVIGTGLAGPANPFNDYDQTINSIVDAASKALIDANYCETNINRLVVGIGLAGVNLPTIMTKMQRWSHPFKAMSVTTDLQIACLGAHDGLDGAIMISGTGSCGFSYINGHVKMIGAHGFPHGDKGSGAWLGLQVVKQVLLSLDGLEKPSLMNQLLLEQLDCSNGLDIVAAVAKQTSSFFAKLAFIVFKAAEKNDALAITIAQDGAKYMSNVARCLLQDKPSRMSLIGGLTPKLTSWLDADVRENLSQPIHSPEMGAVIYAKQHIQR